MGKQSLFILLIVLSTGGCRSREMKIASDETTPVKMTRVTTRTISIPVHSTGVLVSSEEIRLSFKTGGIVRHINVNEGDRVKKGKELASLDPEEINANASQAENAWGKALRDFKRAENLYIDSVVTLEQKQNAATALSVAKATLEIVRFNKVHSTISAPDDGLILKKLVKENEIVSSGFPVLLFGSTGKNWKVRTGLSDRDVVKVNPGDSASVTFDAYPGEKFSAVIDQVGEMSNPYTGTYEIEMLLQKTVLRLASGFIAGVDLFPSHKEEYRIVPVGAIVEADGHQGYVYALTDSLKAQKIMVDIITLIGPMAAVAGLPEGIEEIVSEGAAYLRSGMKVKVIR